MDKERQQLLEAIMHNEGIHRMARNPLLLTIIALIKWQGRALPDLRVQLYDIAAQTLIKSWPLAQRRVELDELLIREWLAPVALRIFSDGKSDLIDEYSLMDELVTSMHRLKSLTDFEARQASEELLESVCQHSGILLPRGHDSDGRNLYGFLHQTFAEYLTAYHLSGLWEENKLVLTSYAHDPYWREVLFLMAGHLGIVRRAKAGHFIKAIHDLSSSQYEHFIHRDLLLAVRILADGVPASPGDLIEALIQEILDLWVDTPIRPLRDDIEQIFGEIVDTEYGPILVRLAKSRQLDTDQIFALAEVLGVSRFIDELRESLNSHLKSKKLHSAYLLAKAGKPTDLERLITMVKAYEYTDTLSPIRAWSIVELIEQQGIEAVVDLLDAPNPMIANFAALSLTGQDDPRGIPVILKAYNKVRKGISPKLRTPFFDELGGPQVINDLIFHAIFLEPQLQLDLAQWLVQKEDERGWSILHGLLDTEEPEVCVEAASLLIKRRDLRAKEILYELLQSPDVEMRLKAAKSLYTELDQRGLDTLAELLEVDAPPIQMEAAKLLLEHDDQRGLDALTKLLDLGTPSDQLQAAKALLEHGDQRGLDTLAELLEVDAPPIQMEAAKLLLEHDDQRGLNALTKLLDLGTPSDQLQAAKVLLEYGDYRGLGIISEFLNSARQQDPDFILELEIWSILGRDGSTEALDFLFHSLKSDRVNVRVNSAILLKQNPTRQTFNILKKHLGEMIIDTEQADLFSVPLGPYMRVAEVAYIFLVEHIDSEGKLQLVKVKTRTPPRSHVESSVKSERLRNVLIHEVFMSLLIDVNQ